MDIVISTRTNAIATDEIAQELKKYGIEGTLYLGYPILAGADETITVDALLVSQKYGLVVFHFPKNDYHDPDFWVEIKRTQDDLYVAINQKLYAHRPLRTGRDLVIKPIVLCYTSSPIERRDDTSIDVVSKETLLARLKELSSVPEEYYRFLVSALQRISTIKPIKKRASVRTEHSKGAILKKIEKEIANLDSWQNHAAIETPEAPQCIRGIAGSGKTVVLALKAAFLHARNPDWNIAVTFHTRSLYQQFKDLIRRFSFDQLGDEPDWTKLKVIHSWGSRSEPGVYSEIASAYGMPIKNFEEAATRYGRREAFSGICEELLKTIISREDLSFYNAVLVDEAQDFPQSFFQLVYRKGLKDPRRLIWAYDELQNLSDYVILPAEQLFGVDDAGTPLVTLRNEEGKPKQDITLPICYRNTPWALTVAHAVGFGIYRDSGLVQLFENASEAVWKSLGYNLISGTVEAGHTVRLKRGEDSSPKYFNDFIKPNDSLETLVFSDTLEQDSWVSRNIVRNLTEDELEPNDILVILPDPLSVAKDTSRLRSMLKSAGFSSHVAGITSSRDELFQENSIAITGIYRAKGNEAPIVYILNSEHCYSGPELIRRRNSLFTAITRSKAWARICGCGENMAKLKKEIDQVVTNGYELKFTVPSDDDLLALKKVYRDITTEEREKLRSLEEVVDLIEKGDMSIEQIPMDLREKLKKQLG